MLSITAVSAGAIDYLLKGSGCSAGDHSPEAVEEVSAGSAGAEYLVSSAARESSGVWFGLGLSMVGISPGDGARVDDVRAVFGQLRHPDSTVEDPVFLGRPPRTFTAVELRIERACAVEPDAGPERRAEIANRVRADRRKAVGYYDLTFSPVKSVSVYWAALRATGRDAEADAVVAAHREAIAEAMAWAEGEGEVTWTRVGYHGRTASGRSVGRYERASGLVWTRWDHHTNRACEPQLHSHVAVLNRVITTGDGQIRALDGKGFRAVKHGIDALYTRGLERRLGESCGVVFGLRPDGKAREIVGIDQALLAEASSRHSAVVERLQELVAEYRVRHGHDPGPAARTKLGRQAALATREAKSDQPVDEQIRAWCAPRWERLHQALVQARSAAQCASRIGRDQRNRPTQVGEEVLEAAVGVVAAGHASWDVGLLMAAIADQLAITTITPEFDVDLPGLAGRVLDHPGRFGIVQVNAPEPGLIPVPEQLRRPGGGSVLRPHRDQRYTTVDQLSLENGIVALAATAGAPALDAAALMRVSGMCDSAGLAPDQTGAVVGIVSSGRLGEVLIGPAGTGKSHTLGVLSRAWRKETGGRVFGLATSQIAATELADNGLDAHNIARFLHHTTQNMAAGGVGVVGSGDLVVVDEVGMTSTADLAAITRLVVRAGGKLVFTGDPEQLAAIDAGGMLGLLAADIGCFELTEVHRFHHRWEQDASLRLRAGDEQVLDMYERHGRLVGGPVEDMAEAAVRAYLADILTGRNSLLVAATNHEAAELAARIRAELVRLGRVDHQVLGVGRDGNPISAGDLVAARRNDPTLSLTRSDGEMVAVTNRATYRVLGADPLTGGIRVTDQTGRIGALPPDYVGEHVTLGYAATVWATQSRTVDTCHALLEPAATRRAAYVALTRGRLANTAYVVCERDGDEHQHEPLASTARAQLAVILTNRDDEVTQTAEAARRAALEEARSLAWIVGQWDLVATEQCKADCEQTIRELLPAATAQRVLREPGYPRLCRAVRAAELSGHDPTGLLTLVVGERSLFDAESICDVLRWRIHTHPSTRIPSDPGTGWAGMTPTRPGPVGNYLAALAATADARQTQLGQHAVHEQPQWAIHHLGPPPNTAADRHEWARRAGAIAAYRDLAAIGDTTISLGVPPSREQPLHHILWQRAVTAAGIPADELDYTSATDHELRQTRATYLSQLVAAPAYVHDELRDARLAATGYHTDAILWAAETELLTPGTEERGRAEADTRAAQHLAAVYATRAERLATTAQARQTWHAATESERTRFELAGDELVRRGLPRDPAPQTAEQLALLAPDLAPSTADRARSRTATPEASPAVAADQLPLFPATPRAAGTGARGTDAATTAAASGTMTATPADENTSRVGGLFVARQLWAEVLNRVQRWADRREPRDHTDDDLDLAHRRRTYTRHHDTDRDLAAEQADDIDLGIGD